MGRQTSVKSKMVAELALVLGLLVSSSCEVRGRDPDLDDEVKEDGPRIRGFYLGATASPHPGARENFRHRNWCALIQERILTGASQCRTEKCSVRSPCPGRQLIMNTVSHCPLHRQKHLIFLWCCCNGSDREHYEMADESTRLTRPSYVAGHHTGAHPSVDLSWEQNDQNTGHVPFKVSTSGHHAYQPNYAQVSYQTSSSPGTTDPGQVSQNYPPYPLQGTSELGQVPFVDATEEQEATPPPYPENPYDGYPQGSIHPYDNFPAPLPVPHMMALVFSQLQPLIQSLNVSLQQLSQQVVVLSEEVAQLKSQQQNYSSGRQEGLVKVEMLDKGDVLETEEVLDKGVVVVTQKVLNKGDILVTEEVLDKGDVLVTEEVLDKGDVLVTQEVLDKGDVLVTQEVLDKGDVLVTEEVLDKGDVLVTQEVLDKRDVLETEKVLDKGDVLVPQEVLDKGDVLVPQEVLDKGDVLVPQEVLDKGDVLVTQEVLDKGEILIKEELLDQTNLQYLEVKMDQALLLVSEVQNQMERQHRNIKLNLQTQQALLLNNLSSFQMDMDLKLQQHKERLQERMDAVNASLVEVHRNHVQNQQTKHDELHSTTLAVHQSVTRLDRTVVANTVKVESLVQSVDTLEGKLRQVHHETTVLDERINQTGRNSQIQFMETGLEVEAARETVLRRVAEMAGNLSMQDQRLQEAESDLDYVFRALSRCESGLVNLTEQVNENRLALDEEKDRGMWPVDGVNDWEPAVEALQRSIQQVKMSVVSEQARSRTIESSQTHVSDSLAKMQLDVTDQKLVQQKQKVELTRLSGSFKSLLEDGIRHNEVLEKLLGEEVLEFLERSDLYLESLSIPAMKDRLDLLQEELTEHSKRIGLIGGADSGGSDETSANQPTSSGFSRERRRSTERTLGGEMFPHPDRSAGEDGGDLWRLEQQVEVLKEKLHLLEDGKNTCCENDTELSELKRELLDHLTVFEKTFRNANVLADSDTPLDLLELRRLAGDQVGGDRRKRSAKKERPPH